MNYPTFVIIVIRQLQMKNHAILSRVMYIVVDAASRSVDNNKMNKRKLIKLFDTRGNESFALRVSMPNKYYKRSEYQKNWRKENPDKAAEYSKTWRLKHPEEKKSRNKAYYLNNKERWTQYHRKYRLRNKKQEGFNNIKSGSKT